MQDFELAAHPDTTSPPAGQPLRVRFVHYSALTYKKPVSEYLPTQLAGDSCLPAALHPSTLVTSSGFGPLPSTWRTENAPAAGSQGLFVLNEGTIEDNKPSTLAAPPPIDRRNNIQTMPSAYGPRHAQAPPDFRYKRRFFTFEQRRILEEAYQQCPRLPVVRSRALAVRLGPDVNAKSVENWFCLRRRKERNTAAMAEREHQSSSLS